MALALSAYPFPYNSSCGHVFISVVKHPGMALLGLDIGITLLKTAKLSFEVVAPFCIPAAG